jgi:DNA-binding beta-propeller fold protein YncE
LASDLHAVAAALTGISSMGTIIWFPLPSQSRNAMHREQGGSMRRTIFWICLIMTSLAAAPSSGTFRVAAAEVKRVDFLAGIGLQVNGAGPLLVRMDPARNRLVVANTLTSSVSLIDCRSRSVRNVPIATRVPQYLKSEALAVDSRSGNVYVIGNRTLEVVFPGSGRARSFSLRGQYEMVAVDEASGNAVLVGRESRDMAWVDLKRDRVTYVPWSASEERARNLNQTPPPPIRKVVCDNAARRILAVDGTTSTLHAFAAVGGRRLSRRPLDLQPGGRWHFAGYSQKRQALVLVVETAERKVIQAAKIATAGGRDEVVPLPGFTEAVGVRYHEERDELYIPYDNHPSLHVVDFKDGGRLSEVKLPAYGNDASALDAESGLLYIASWAYGEIDQVDLKNRRLRRRFFQAAVLPHMFNMEFNPNDGKLFIPLGATAVNGSFGAAVSVFDPTAGVLEKILTGWAPQELLPQPGSDAFLAFNNEDQFARVTPGGEVTTAPLPVLYPHQALATPAGNIYLSYGPHQSYWPVVYIWAARNGILGIDGRDLGFYDRRIPRLAQGMALSPSGALFALQNNWGDEKQFYIMLGDEVRAPNQGDMRVELEDTVSRETTQRLLAYDAASDWLLLARVGETDGDNGVLQVVEAKTGKLIHRQGVGITPTALAVDGEVIYVLNFDSDSLTVIRKADFSRRDLPCGRKPLRLALARGVPHVINHEDNSLSVLGEKPRTLRIPFPGRPDQIACIAGRLWITNHSDEELFLITFDPAAGKFSLRLREKYPYGEASFSGNNTSFYVRGQFGDCLYDLCKIRAGANGSVWISDFLAGKLFIIPAGE